MRATNSRNSLLLNGCSMFTRRVLHHGSDPDGTPQLLSLSTIRDCWFELHRQGGCGAGELSIAAPFEQRDEIAIGDWVSFEAAPGERWYLGRVEERRAESPARTTLRLEGMGIELNEVFPGGFGSEADGRRPHRYGLTDRFSLDPDYDEETVDEAGEADEVVRLLMQQYAQDSNIQYLSSRVEAPTGPAPVESLKLRGEESLRSLLKELAVRGHSASWGVDELGEFFFLRPRTEILLTLRESRDLTKLAEATDQELLVNRLLLTGDYVYDRRDASDDVARRSARWRVNLFEPTSRATFGDRRLRLWIPWIRTATDSTAFAREFFRTYAFPARRFFLETTGQSALFRPWLGRVRIENRHGETLTVARVETLRVLFDHVPRFRMEVGPDDPRNLWPEPPHDERWEIPNQPQPGGSISLTSSSESSDGGPDSSEPDDSTGGDPGSSGLPPSSGDSSAGSSGESSGSSDAPDSSATAPTSPDGLPGSSSAESEGSSEGSGWDPSSDGLTSDDSPFSSDPGSDGTFGSSSDNGPGSSLPEGSSSDPEGNSSAPDDSSSEGFPASSDSTPDSSEAPPESSEHPGDPTSTDEPDATSSGDQVTSSSEAITFVWE